MMIFWGKKTTYRTIGYVVDFCKVCREQKIFKLQRVGLANHVYYFSLGEGTLIKYERTCKKCSVTFDADIAIYSHISKKIDSFKTLKRKTFPNLEEVMKEQLELEEKIYKRPFSFTNDERQALIRECFLMFSSKIEKRFSSTHIDKETGIMIAATYFIPLIAFKFTRANFPNLTMELTLTLAAIGMILTIWFGFTSKIRFIKKQIIPFLSKCLHPLQPTDDELKLAIITLKERGFLVGKKINPSHLAKYIQDIDLVK